MKLAGILIGSAFAKGIIKETKSCEGTCNSQNRDCTKDCRVGDLQCLSACSRAYDKCLQECRGNQLNFVVFDPEKDSQVKVTWLYQSQGKKIHEETHFGTREIVQRESLKIVSTWDRLWNYK